MSESGILDRNLVALSTRQPDLASRLSSSKPDENLSFIESRIGLPVPILPRDGRPFPMHSRFDPILEDGNSPTDHRRGTLWHSVWAAATT
jgi:hypothetical protein